MDLYKNLVSNWSAEYEKEHPDSVIEWWCAEAFFKTIEDNKKWVLKAVLTEWLKKTKSKCNITLFDQNYNKKYIYLSQDLTKTLSSEDNSFNIKYGNSYIKGSFPEYEMYFDDKNNNIKIYMKYQAKVIPHWVASEITNGLLPMGLGYFRYGFIPKCDLSGTMKIENKTFTLKGTGYFEHVRGKFQFEKPLTPSLKFKKLLSMYTKIVGWWFHNHTIKIPESLIFTTENNPFGYDWVWALFDNGWSLFYGNIMFWLMKGPAAGMLYLVPNERKYVVFPNIHFRYLKTRYMKEYDFFYPSELEVKAFRGKEKLYLIFKMENDAREYISRFSDSKNWIGLAICEAPGSVVGYYSDGERKIQLKGICKIEPQRQISKLGHNSLKIDFLLPPKDIGFSMDIDSHYFMKKANVKVKLAPKLKFNFSFKRISKI